MPALGKVYALGGIRIVVYNVQLRSYSMWRLVSRWMVHLSRIDVILSAYTQYTQKHASC